VSVPDVAKRSPFGAPFQLTTPPPRLPKWGWRRTWWCGACSAVPAQRGDGEDACGADPVEALAARPRPSSGDGPRDRPHHAKRAGAGALL